MLQARDAACWSPVGGGRWLTSFLSYKWILSNKESSTCLGIHDCIVVTHSCIPSPVDLPDLEIESGSPALQADSFPTELWGKPHSCNQEGLILSSFWICLCDFNPYLAAFVIVEVSNGLPQGASLTLPACEELLRKWNYYSPLPEACRSRRHLQELNGLFTLFPHLPPFLILRRTWHPGLDKMVILRHSSVIFSVSRSLNKVPSLSQHLISDLLAYRVASGVSLTSVTQWCVPAMGTTDEGVFQPLSRGRPFGLVVTF